jgi:RHS repeat-associated protein
VISQTEGYGPGVPWNNLTFLNDQFQYDNLSRLSSVTDTNYSRGYHYDEFGNISVQSYSVIAPPGFAPQNNGGNPYNAATNHLVAVDAAGGYEARGMVTKLGPGGTVQMAYDAEGNMKNSSDSGMGGQSVTWIYDAEGQRAEKVVAGGSSTLYVHDAFGQLAATYNNNGVTPACTTCYLTYDMLGSPRLITDQTDSVIARHDFIPFGEEIPNTVAGRNGNFGSSSNVTQGFTGQESDGGSAGLDFYNARHFSAVMGSFMQPDPGNAGADFLRPQSWNGYSYVLGNPLGLVDPSGMIGKDPDGIDDGDCFDAGNSSPCGYYPVGGGGGGGGGGPRGGGPGPAPTLPPVSFPSGENLGMPPGLTVPNPLSAQVLLGLSGWDCGLGACVPGVGPMNVDPNDIDFHHVFSQQFRAWFASRGIDNIDDYLIPISAGLHRLKKFGGIHTKLGGNWNARWGQFIKDYPTASKQEIFDFARKLIGEFGLGGYPGSTLPSPVITLNPCLFPELSRVLDSCYGPM